MQFVLSQQHIFQKTLIALCAGLLFVALPLSAAAQFNPEINYQGKLTNASGVAVPDGLYNMNFWLVPTQGGATSTAVWSEARTSGNRVQVTNGLFSVMLGEVATLDSVDFNQTLYLGVEIGGISTTTPTWDGEMSPRKILGAVPAAFVAETASSSNALSGIASSSFLRSDEADTMQATSSSPILSIIQNGAGAIARFFSGVTEVFTILGNGNVGVGTSTPSSAFAVSGTTTLAGNLITTGSSTLATTTISRLNLGTALTAVNGGTGLSSVTQNQLLIGGAGNTWTQVATSSLGLGNGTFLGLTDTPSSYTANRVIFTNGGATALTDSANFTFDGTNLGLGAQSRIAFGGTNYIYASSTNDSIVFGENAGATFNNNTTYNVAIGFQAGRYASTTNVDYNNFIGYQAGYENTGSFVNAFGYQAGNRNTGDANSIIGYRAAYSNTGSDNLIFGDYAGYDNSGNNNYIIGENAGYTNSGDINNIIGYYAGNENTGSYNDFIGFSAGNSNTGDYNQMIGSEAGYNLRATSSIIIGAEAYRGGAGSTAFSAVNNVALGYRAGYNATTSADNNILIGYRAADNITTGNNNIIIGYDIDNVTATADNRLNIGNLIFGTGLDGTGTTLASGNVGIGSTTPSARLTVQGASGSIADTFRVASSSGATALAVLANRNVEVPGQIISAGIEWIRRDGVGATDDGWRGVTYGNGLFVAVSAFLGDAVMTSPDGINWTARTTGSADGNWTAVTYGNGLFVAVGTASGNDAVMTSPDGVNWTPRSAAEGDDDWKSVTYGNGLFVAVAQAGDDLVMTSPDGINWTTRTAAGNDDIWEGVVYGNGLFVAVSDTNDKVMTSPDGITWTPQTAVGNDDNWSAITYGNGLFVAVSYGGDRVMTSPDGVNWTARSAGGDNDSWAAITYGGGLFVAVASSGTGNRIITSPDGINWTERTAAGDNDNWQAITYGNGMFVAVSYYDADPVMTSGKTSTNALAANNIFQGGLSVFDTFRVGTTSSAASLFVQSVAGLTPFTVASSTGTSMLTLSQAGNFGIGSSSPASLLTVSGNTYIGGELRLVGGLRDGANATGTLGMVLQTTGTSTRWVATSTLGLGGVSTFLALTDTPSSYTANRIIFTNTGATALTDSANFTFDGTNLGLGAQSRIAFGGTNYLYASSTNDSVVFGESAGATFTNLTTNNVAIGFEAGRYASTTNADENNYIGYRAGSNNTGANNNIFGYNTAQFNTGSFNNVIGYQAGYNNTGANNNIFGQTSAYNNTGANNNIFGLAAGFSNTGTYNNIIGDNAGQANNGSFNNLIGYLAGSGNTGNFNEIIGAEAGRYLRATSSVVVGTQAYRGAGLTNFSAINNVALGYQAGYNATTSADNNILIGYRAADNLTTGNNNIIIGYDIDNVTATADNRLNIGNLIFGTGLDGTGTTLASGNVGIGSTTPSARLTVQGASGSTAPTFSVASSTGSTTFTVLANGNVGIGTSTPSNKLDILGGGINIVENTAPQIPTIRMDLSSAVDEKPFIYATANRALNYGIALENTNSGGSVYNSMRVGSADIDFSLVQGGGDGLAVFASPDGGGNILSMLTDNGNVGIGTTTQASKLTVVGDMRLTGAFRDGSNASGTLGMVLQSTGTTTRWVATSSLGISGGASTFLALTDTPSSYTANRVIFTNGGATALTDSANFTFDGTNLGLGAQSRIAFGGTNYIYASSTNDSVVFGENAGATFNNNTIFNTAIGFEAGRYASSTSNDWSVFIGYRSGRNSTSTFYGSNVFIGSETAEFNVGGQNTFIGEGAGQLNNGNFGVFLGSLAGQFNTESYSNLIGSETGRNNAGLALNAVGSRAGANNIADYVNAIGEQAGEENAGTSTNLFGYHAGYFNTGSSSNIFGSFAGYSNDGDYVNLIGQNAGRNNQGDYANFFGFEAGATSTGAYNNFFGYRTGADNTGSDNNIFGRDAGRFNSGTDNNIFGWVAGYNNTGTYNNLLGVAAGEDNSGSAINALGYRAGQFNSGDDLNTFGYESGRFNQGDYNNFMGAFAGSQNDASFVNAFGLNAGSLNTGSSTNLFGPFAGYQNTGDYVDAIGALAGYNNIGDYNSFMGYSAGATSTGSYNLALGYFAAASSSGTTNNIFGRLAGQFNAGSYNNILGYDAGANNIGSYNNLLGQDAGHSNIGSYNNLFGLGAGYANSGSNNNFFGYDAGWHNNGNFNELIGSEAGRNVQGSNSVLIGAQAFRGGAGFSAFSATNNVALGYQAGYNATTSADNNILIGYRAADNLTTGNNNIIIGYDIDNVTATADNRLNIGNLIFGTGLDGTGTTLASGNVGIGTSTPGSKLSVAGDLRLTGAFRDGSNASGTLGMVLQSTGTSTRWVATSTLGITGGGGSLFTDAGATTYLTATGDNLAIGTTTASSKLTIDGDISIFNNVNLGQTSRINVAGERYIHAYTLNNSFGVNQFMGYQAGNFTSGSSTDAFLGIENLGIGRGALSALTEGSNNTAVGMLSMQSNTTGAFNTGLGYQSLVNNTTGAFNTGLGSFALRSNTLGGNNTGVGTDSLQANTIGGANTALGAGSLYGNTEGNDNSAFGFAALYNNSTGSSNTAMGWYALNSNTTGNNNVAIGESALRYNATGSQNIAIGASAGTNLTSGNRNIIIGENINAPLSTGSNQLNIGNIIFGTNVDGTGNTLSSGNIGIGTSTPGSKLTVAGDMRVTSGIILGSEPAITLAVKEGNLALGTYALMATNFNNVYSNTAVGMGAATSLVDGWENTFIGDAAGVRLSTTSASVVIGAGAAGSAYGGTSAGGLVIIGRRAGYNLTDGANNNTIIGTQAGIAMTSGNSNTLLGYQAGDNITTGSNNIVIGSDIDAASTTRNNTLNIGNLIFGTGLDGTGTTLSSGNIGIGTTTPQARLALERLNFNSTTGAAGIDQYFSFNNSSNGATIYGNRSYIYATNTATTTVIGSILRVADSTTFGNTVRGLEVQADNGNNTQGENTGIAAFGRTFGVRGTTVGDAGGTFEPAGIYGETEGTTQGNAIRGYSSSITTAALLKLFQDTSAFTGTGLLMNFGNAGGSFSSTTASRFIDLQNAGTSRFTVGAYGMTTIGDGTTNNNAGLQIGYGGLCVDNDGSCNASTTGRVSAVSYYTANSDLAETYFSSEDLKTGEVVYLKGELSVGRASEATEEKIIGVVTTKPGLLLGSDDSSLRAGEDAFGIALAGRVPVRLSNENGPIKAGDELMLSSIPGVAMKASSTGVVVGIALEDFEETRAYSDTYINQFGDDIVDPVVTPINPNNDPRINDGCYYGAGSASGDAPCVPLQATTTDAQAAEAEALALAEAQAEALEALKDVPSDVVTLDNGETVRVGQVVMFVALDKRYLDEDGIAMVAALLASGEGADEDATTDTVWSRLVTLANNFIDGVLSVLTLKADRVEVQNEICVDGVCLNAEDIRQLLDGNSAAPAPEETPEPEPVIEEEESDEENEGGELPPAEEIPNETGTSTEDGTETESTEPEIEETTEPTETETNEVAEEESSEEEVEEVEEEPAEEASEPEASTSDTGTSEEPTL